MNFLNALNRKFTTAIIAGAGSGSRMNGACENKLLYKIDNIPVICHTIIAYAKASTISEIIIVVHESMLSTISELIREYKLDEKVKIIISGGETRFKSVILALDSISKYSKYVAIADAARPYIKPEQINSVSYAAYKYKAAALCSNVYDTIKTKSKDGFISATVDRNNLLAMQTPQTFDLKLYKKGVSAAMALKKEITDDCMIMECISQKVYPVVTDGKNIKITTPADLI